MGRVTQLLSRLRVLVCELIARNAAPTQLHQVVPPSLHADAFAIGLIPSKHIQSQARTVIPILIPKHSKNDESIGSLEMQSEQEVESYGLHICQETMEALESLRYYRRHVQMRVRFGTFVVDTYKRSNTPRYTLDEFRDLMSDAMTKVRVLPK